VLGRAKRAPVLKALYIQEINLSAFSFIPKEDARVEKNNGDVLGPYSATFTSEAIIVWDETADVEEGDVILRTLPSGRDERSNIEDAQFYQKVSSIPAHYKIKFTKGAKKVMNEKQPANITIGSAGSVQIGDNNSQSIVNNFNTLIEKINESQATEEEKVEAKNLLSKLISHPLIVSILGAAAGALIK